MVRLFVCARVARPDAWHLSAGAARMAPPAGMVVFVTAMKALEVPGLTSRYAYGPRLVGGIVLPAVGLLLLWRTPLLMFA